MVKTRDRLHSYHTPKAGYRKETEWELYKKLSSRIAIALLVLAAMYFWGLAILSNIHMFWRTLNLQAERAPKGVSSDRIPPSPPFISTLPVATKESKINIKGFSEEGATVKLFVNGSEAGKALADKSGAFSFEDVPLSEGENTIFARASDGAGNESRPSKKIAVDFDQRPPNLEVDEPKNFARFEQKEEEITIKGRTEPDTKVTVNSQQTIVDQEGVFNTLYALKDGQNKLEIEAEDLAGNKTVIERTVHFSRVF